MTKYKVGDKVRILNAEAIRGADEHDLKTGGIYPVTSLDSFGDPRVNGLTLFERELCCIEKVEDTNRITELEAKVSELEAKFEALKEALQ